MTAVDRTVAHLNIEHYRRLLATETDGGKRAMLKKLLAEEEAKLSAAGGNNTQPGGIRSNGRHD